MFSRSCTYGIRAVIYLTSKCNEDRLIPVKEISKETDVPLPFMAKVLQALAKDGVISSKKGPHGGFYIPRAKCQNLKVGEVVRSIDGDHLFVGCAMGLSACDENNPCPMHDNFLKIRNDLAKMLSTTSVKHVVQNLDGKLVFKR